MKLYICGNGFDIHHGYKTRYSDYREFLLEHHFHSFKAFDRFQYLDLSLSDKWSDLEQSLTIDYDQCISDAISEYYPDLNDDGDSRWYGLVIDLEEQTKFIYDFTGRYFLEWLTQIDFSNTNNILSLDKSALYITFNYTNTLEEIYKIDPDNIFHIHGSLDLVDSRNILDWFVPRFSTIEEAEVEKNVQVDEINNDTIREQIQFGSIGNNIKAIKTELEDKYGQDDFYSVSIEPAISHLISFCNATSKNLDENYEALNLFIRTKNIDEVVIMGHSIMGVDNAYYSDVIVPVLKDCHWTFYCYSDDNRNDANLFVKQFSLKNYLLKEW